MADTFPAITSLTEPSSTPAMTDAASWLQGTMLGSVATIIAVLAVAAVGAGLFTGRLNARRGLTVVMGCFVLFGSAVIANALMGLIDNSPSESTLIAAEPMLPPSPLPAPTRSEPSPYDPYAGASVARR
jgi:type IV secretion system protein VirB2